MSSEPKPDENREIETDVPHSVLERALQDILRAAQSNLDMPECHADALEAIARIAENALRHASDPVGRVR